MADDPFYQKCFISHFENHCFAGFSILFLGFMFFLIHLYAFIIMTKYYGKMNFENTILLLSLIQMILLIIELILTESLSISGFIFIQILSMCLINFKFKKISKGFVNLRFFHFTIITGVINIVYLFIVIIFFIISKIKNIKNIEIFYFNIFYYLLELLSSILLSYNCCVFLDLIKPNQQNNKTKNEKNNNNIIEVDDNIKKLINLSHMNKDIGDGLFYLIKKRQFSLLYLGNILCTIFAFIIDGILTAVHGDLKRKNKLYNYLYYVYFLLCYIHNSINFICFYWMIREQYQKKKTIEPEIDDEDKLIVDDDIKVVIDDLGKENSKLLDLDEKTKNNNDDSKIVSFVDNFTEKSK